MLKKTILLILTLFMLMGIVSAIDSSNWTTVDVGYETFKIPPKYSQNPYESDFDIYMYDFDIDEFSIRYVNPNIMMLYGYFCEKNHIKKVVLDNRDAVHFFNYDRNDESNNSILWFSAGEEFYYITWRGNNITPVIKEVVKSILDIKKAFFKVSIKT